MVKGTILVIESPWRPMLPAVDIPASLRASFRWRIPCYVHGLAMLCFLALRVMVCAVPCVCVLLSYRVGLWMRWPRAALCLACDVAGFRLRVILTVLYIHTYIHTSAVSEKSVRGEKVQCQNIRKTKGAADPTSRRHTNPEACFPKLRLLEGSP